MFPKQNKFLKIIQKIVNLIITRIGNLCNARRTELTGRGGRTSPARQNPPSQWHRFYNGHP